MQGIDQPTQNSAVADPLESVAPGVSLLDSILLLLTPEQRQHFLESAGIEGVVYANRASTFDKPLALKITKPHFRDMLKLIGRPAHEVSPRQWECDYDDPEPLAILKKDLEAGVRLSPPPRDWFGNHPEGDDVPIRIESKRFGIPCRVRPHVYGGSAYLEATALEPSDFSKSSEPSSIEDVESDEEVLDDPVDVEQLSSAFTPVSVDGSGASTCEFTPHIVTTWDVLGPNSKLSPDFDRAALGRLVSQLVTNGRHSAISRATRERCEMLEGLVRLKQFASQYPYTLANQSGDTFEFQVQGPPEALAGIKRAYVYRDVEEGSRRDRVAGILLERVGRRNQCQLFRIPEGFQCDTPPASGYLVDTGDISQLQKQLDALRELRHPSSRPHLLQLGTLLSSDNGGLGEPVSWDTAPIRMVDDKLTERQVEAVRKALATPDICLIQGPPGTGKTRVISEIVRQAARKNWKVLLVAPTHVAVDNVLERIGIQEDVSPVRCVRRAKLEDLPEHIQEFTYERRSGLLANETGRRSESDRATWECRVKQLGSELEILRRCAGHRKSMDDLEQQSGQDRLQLSEVDRDAEREIARVRSTKDQAVLELEAERKQRSDALGQRLNVISEQDRRRDQARRDAEALTRVRQQGVFQRLTSSVWLRSFFSNYERAAQVAQEQGDAFRRDRDEIQAQLGDVQQRLDRAKVQRDAEMAEVRDREHTRARHRREELDKKLEANRLKSESLRESFDAEVKTIPHRDVRFEAPRISFVLHQLTAEHEQAQRRLALLAEWTQYLGRESENLKDRLAQYVNLVCATTVGIATDEYFGDKGAFAEKQFDLLVVDEAGKVTEPEFLVAAVRAKRWVLVGDHKQLPPYYDQILDPYLRDANKARQAADQPPLDAQALQLSIFERLWNRLNPRQPSADSESAQIGASRCVTLDVQRRMHPDLAVFVSEMFYGGEYYSPDGDDYKQSKTLDLAHFPKPVTFIDVCPGKGADGYEVDLSKRDQRKRHLAEHDAELPEDGYANLREAEQVIQVLEAIANDAALQREHTELEQARDQVPLVGIIALYAGQVALIHRLIRLSGTLRGERVSGSDWLCGGMLITVNSVDAFQGKECPVIILSFTRSNRQQAVGFVNNSNRLNVALSRARKKLVLVGDTETLTRRARERPDGNKDSRAAGKERDFFVQLIRYVEGRGKTMRVFERRSAS